MLAQSTYLATWSVNSYKNISSEPLWCGPQTACNTPCNWQRHCFSFCCAVSLWLPERRRRGLIYGWRSTLRAFQDKSGQMCFSLTQSSTVACSSTRWEQETQDGGPPAILWSPGAWVFVFHYLGTAIAIDRRAVHCFAWKAPIIIHPTWVS